MSDQQIKEMEEDKEKNKKSKNKDKKDKKPKEFVELDFSKCGFPLPYSS
jgi:hypothetical protein